MQKELMLLASALRGIRAFIIHCRTINHGDMGRKVG
jgi:hypothetical protein